MRQRSIRRTCAHRRNRLHRRVSSNGCAPSSHACGMNLSQLFKPRPPRADPNLPRTVLGAMREDRGRFADLRDARVLVYWPHGLGDWVHLSTIAPLLERSNTYAITRFGDDYVSLMDGNRYFTPLYSGVRAPGDGAEQGARHL